MEQHDRQPALRLAFSGETDICASNADTIRELRKLLTQAQQGALTGIAFVAMYGGHKYCPKVIGDARTNPTFTRGMVRALDDLLTDLVAPTRGA